MGSVDRYGTFSLYFNDSMLVPLNLETFVKEKALTFAFIDGLSRQIPDASV